MTGFDHATRAAYGAAAAVWAAGPERVYRHLAVALLNTAPTSLHGRLLLDIGAGTGVLADEATRRGARCVESDAAVEMLAHRRRRTRRVIAADARRLPFAGATFTAVTAACSLSHVDEPDEMLGEIRRVLHADGVLLASAFPPTGDPHPVRAVVEQALSAFGYRRPAWYEHLKETGERRVESPVALTGMARAAGYGRIDVAEVAVDTGITAPDALVDYRLGMAQHIAFLASLDDDARMHLRSEAIARLGPSPPPLTLGLLVLIVHP